MFSKRLLANRKNVPFLKNIGKRNNDDNDADNDDYVVIINVKVTNGISRFYHLTTEETFVSYMRYANISDV